ncbi:peptidase 1 [Russula vinacea]|nr:peptidase 1 [Russula vinacea]
MRPVTRLDGRTKPGSYIVILKRGLKKPDFLDKHNLRGKLTHEFHPRCINGFCGKFSDEQLNIIRAHPDVALVTEDGIASIRDTVAQTDAFWGTARLGQDQGLAIRTSEEASDYDYNYDQSSGDNVDIYILDTGVYIDHSDFGGRATWGKTFVGNTDTDANGHVGTHCAGIAAGTKFGVAKRANIIAVKVLGDDGHGPYSDIIAGIDYVLDRFKASGVVPVVSMSLGGPASDALDAAVQSLIDHGVHVVIAAGNAKGVDPDDAGQYSPARVKDAITVGASAIDDSRWLFSCIGSCLDLFAPGDDITSAAIGSKDATLSRSGTSMATPHVAGLIAYSLALDGDCSPADMKEDLKKSGLSGILKNIRMY